MASFDAKAPERAVATVRLRKTIVHVYKPGRRSSPIADNPSKIWPCSTDNFRRPFTWTFVPELLWKKRSAKSMFMSVTRFDYFDPFCWREWRDCHLQWSITFISKWGMTVVGF